MSDQTDEPQPSLVPPTPPAVVTPAEERGRHYLEKAINMQRYMLGNLLFVGIAHGLLVCIWGGRNRELSLESITYNSVILWMIIGAIRHITILKPLNHARPAAWRVAVFLPVIVISGVLLWYGMMSQFIWNGGWGDIGRIVWFVILILPLTPYFICSIVSSVYLLKTEVRSLIGTQPIIKRA